MSHCVESGYALVSKSGELAVLDDTATVPIVEAVESDGRRDGIYLVVHRNLEDGEMKTKTVQPAQDRETSEAAEEVESS